MALSEQDYRRYRDFQVNRSEGENAGIPIDGSYAPFIQGHIVVPFEEFSGIRGRVRVLSIENSVSMPSSRLNQGERDKGHGKAVRDAQVLTETGCHAKGTLSLRHLDNIYPNLVIISGNNSFSTRDVSSIAIDAHDPRDKTRLLIEIGTFPNGDIDGLIKKFFKKHLYAGESGERAKGKNRS